MKENEGRIDMKRKNYSGALIPTVHYAKERRMGGINGINGIMNIIIALLLALAAADAAFAQDTLAILPFTGGQGEDGETIAELFSFEKDLNAVFSPVPRTSINAAVKNEQRFQMSSGMTNPDTLAALGRQLGAQYVVAGAITALGSQNLLIIAILKIDDLRQVAGDIQTYGSISEIRGKLPAMARNIIDAVKIDASGLPRLAVPPLQLAGGADRQEADVLAQILAVHLVRSGKYAVYPRTKSLEQVQTEYGNLFGGDVADEYLPKMGMGDNPRLVLSVRARSLSSGETMFNASVINLETGRQETGGTVDYRSLDKGIRIMEELTLALTGQGEELARRAAEQAARERERMAAEQAARARQAAEQAERERKAAKRAEIRRNLEDFFAGWSLGLSVGTTFRTPLLTLSPSLGIPFVHLYGDFFFFRFELGCDFGFISNADYIEDLFYNSYYPFIRTGFFLGNDFFGWHTGLGYGCMIADYRYEDIKNRAVVSAFDIETGFMFFNFLDISYSLRTNFKNVNHKLSVGYVIF
jgi:hypothetical protein